MIQVVVVEGRGGKELCYAPYLSISTGDEVETDFFRGKVIDTESILTDDHLWLMLNQCMRVDRVNAVIKELKYEEEVKKHVVSD